MSSESLQWAALTIPTDNTQARPSSLPLGDGPGPQCTEPSAVSNLSVPGSPLLHLTPKPSLVTALLKRVHQLLTFRITQRYYGQEVKIFWTRCLPIFLTPPPAPVYSSWKYIVLLHETSSWRGYHELPLRLTWAPYNTPQGGMSSCPLTLSGFCSFYNAQN